MAWSRQQTERHKVYADYKDFYFKTLLLEVSHSVVLPGSFVKMNCDNFLNTEEKQII